MAIREILKMGDPRLLRRAQPVVAMETGDFTEARREELRALIEDMFDTMHAAGGAGLAAPQIGVDQRVVIFGTGEVLTRYPDAPPVPPTILINPLIEPIGDDKEDDWEGCLSVPGLRGKVPRYRQLRYRGFDPDGAPIDRTVDGFHARVVQHECDHLDGVLYPMRIQDFSQFGFVEVLFPGTVVRDD